MNGSSHSCTSSSLSSEDRDGVDELSSRLLSQMNINDDEDEDDDFFEEDLLAQMGYAESDPKRDYDEAGEEEDLSQDLGHLKNESLKQYSSPDLNLVSAFKGSREKEGRSVKESRVSWAPDVYDPPTTSDDHSIQSNMERHRVEHKARPGAGKNKQKGGGGGGGSKDKKKAEKKKHKKRGGNTSRYSDHGEF